MMHGPINMRYISEYTREHSDFSMVGENIYISGISIKRAINRKKW